MGVFQVAYTDVLKRKAHVVEFATLGGLDSTVTKCGVTVMSYGDVLPSFRVEWPEQAEPWCEECDRLSPS